MFSGFSPKRLVMSHVCHGLSMGLFWLAVPSGSLGRCHPQCLMPVFYQQTVTGLVSEALNNVREHSTGSTLQVFEQTTTTFFFEKPHPPYPTQTPSLSFKKPPNGYDKEEKKQPVRAAEEDKEKPGACAARIPLVFGAVTLQDLEYGH